MNTSLAAVLAAANLSYVSVYGAADAHVPDGDTPGTTTWRSPRGTSRSRTPLGAEGAVVSSLCALEPSSLPTATRRTDPDYWFVLPHTAGTSY